MPSVKVPLPGLRVLDRARWETLRNDRVLRDYILQVSPLLGICTPKTPVCSTFSEKRYRHKVQLWYTLHEEEGAICKNTKWQKCVITNRGFCSTHKLKHEEASVR